LRDRSELLKQSDKQKDWTHEASFTYVKICDKSDADHSLVHLIAKRAGIEAVDIDCCTIPLTLKYVKLGKNVWAELSELAMTYRCHLECAMEKPLVFAHSPYQGETLQADEDSYIFTGENIFYMRETERADRYRNSVRLKVNMSVAHEKCEIWKYTDVPVLYQDDMTPYYPFRNNINREIQNDGYEARYRLVDAAGNVTRVLYADEIDTQGEAEARIVSTGGIFSFAKYDTASYHDKALITLTGEGNLLNASIYGRPIVMELNRSCFLNDVNEIAAKGTHAINVTGKYFSEDEVNGQAQYEDWAARELLERLTRKNEITIKTHRAVFHARVGATARIRTAAKNYRGVITGLTQHYKRGEAFAAAFRMDEL
jgi:hypothetical protein